MNGHQVFLAQKSIGSNASQSIVAQVDVTDTGKNGQNVELWYGIDTGINIFQIVIISQSVVIAQSVC